MHDHNLTSMAATATPHQQGGQDSVQQGGRDGPKCPAPTLRFCCAKVEELLVP